MAEKNLISVQNRKIKNSFFNNNNIDAVINHTDHQKEALAKTKLSKIEILTKNNLNFIDSITTERKKIITKESFNNDSNDTSVDIKTEFGDENLEIKNAYIFNSHGSSLEFLFNSKLSNSIPKDIKNSHQSIKKEIISKREIEKEKKNNEKLIKNIEENNKEKTPISEKNSEKSVENSQKKEINLSNNSKNTQNYIMNEDFSFNYDIINNYKEIYFKEAMMFKKIEFERNYELNIKKDIFHTLIIYKNKECILLLKKEFLYILEKKPDLKEKEKETKNNNNPDISLINNLQNDELLKNINKNIIKYNFELSTPLLCLNFNLLSCKILLNKNNNNNYNDKKNIYEIQIIILGTSTKFTFYFQNYEIYKKFIYIIGSKIKSYEGNNSNKLGLSLRTKNFYKETYISTRDFEEIAQTGDLLLFRTFDCLSDCQRLFTRDKYDHIALIIRINGEIELLESNSTENCNTLEWRAFKWRLYNLVFKKIVLRKLNIEEENPDKLEEIKENLQKKSNEFIEKINKKKYNMSILKMIIDRKPKEYEITGNWEEAKGFCCSALTAAFYIYNGVMKLEKSIHCVKPGDFEQDRNRITILPGFSFGPEKIIEFST